MSFIQKFTKRDFVFALLTGLITGTIAWRVFEYLHVTEFQNIHWGVLVLVIPILWILGVLLGYLLGQWLQFFNQFGKFVAIGFTNFAVNAAILNILLARTGYTDGTGYALITSAAFIVAMLSGYMWNKYWAFYAGTSQRKNKNQFGKFILVTLIAFGVNVAVASIVVNYIQPVLNFTPEQWANVGTVVGSAVALVFSFIGFKLAVFKK